jgi:dihydrofolate reductase
MRPLTYLIAVSLDGRIADADHSTDGFSFGPEMAEWMADDVPETLPTHIRSAMGIDDRENRRFDTVVMGRSTYEVGLRQGVSSPYGHLRQIVVSATLAAAGEGDPRVEILPSLDADRFDEVVGPSGSGVWLCGGGILAASLARRIDELVLKRHPVVLGEGRPLFAGDAPQARWEPASRESLDDVIVETHRRRR